MKKISNDGEAVPKHSFTIMGNLGEHAPRSFGALSVYGVQLGYLKEAMRVCQLVPVVVKYSVVYQNVQPSLGSIVIEDSRPSESSWSASQYPEDQGLALTKLPSGR